MTGANEVCSVEMVRGGGLRARGAESVMWVGARPEREAGGHRDVMGSEGVVG